mmetsp:Transcript_28243/g.83435  ORF Transcript_28243/g.83435 Transcript_28243/m.83435 type:complete len:211 (+) Transcript_28243:390-1022(+)
MSTALPLVLHRPHDCVVNLELVRKVQLLKREREGRVGAAHARDRCLEVVKARVLDGGGNLGAKAGGEWRLVRHQQPARLLDRVADRVHVPRRNRLQVDDLARHALCRRPLARARHRVHLCPPRDASDVLSGREDLGLPERQHVVAGGHVADRGAVQDLRLEEEAPTHSSPFPPLRPLPLCLCRRRGTGCDRGCRRAATPWRCTHRAGTRP